MDWLGVNFRGKRPNKITVPFCNSLRINNNHLYKKMPRTKAVPFKKIKKTVTKTFTYVYRFRELIVKRNFGVPPSFLRPLYQSVG